MTDSRTSSLYDPLHGDRQIRLLRLLPSQSKDAEIKCELRVVSLESLPLYAALSYTWGIPAPVHEILCNEHRVTIRSNLHNALLRLRKQNSVRVLWIDALCIDQDNLDEKCLQIPLMRFIYAGAGRVLTWFGEESDDSAFAIDFLSGLASLRIRERNSLLLMWGFEEIWMRDRDPLLIDNDHQAVVRKLCTLKPALSTFLNSGSNPWTAVYSLLSRDWFQRVWIIQEILFSRGATILCGGSTLSWDILANLVNDSFLYPASQHIWQSVVLIISLSLQNTSEDDNDRSLPFPKTLLATSYTFATDPRDKIFAILGIVDAKGGHLPPIKIDYSLPVKDLYISVTRSLFADAKDMIIFELVDLDRQDFDLPSWTPNWNSQLHFPKSFIFHNAGLYLTHISLDEKIELYEANLPGELCIRGKVVDRILCTGTSLPDSFFDSSGHLRDLGEEKEAARTQLMNEWRPMIERFQLSGVLPVPLVHPTVYESWTERLDSSTVTSYREGSTVPNNGNDVHLLEIANLLLSGIATSRIRQLCVTERGVLCLAPSRARIGDAITLFCGGSPYFVLSEHNSLSYNTLVGPCWLRLCKGEAHEFYQANNSSWEKITLR